MEDMTIEQYIDNYMLKVKPALKDLDNGSYKQQLFDLLEYLASNIKKLEWKRFGETDRMAVFNFGHYCIMQNYQGAQSVSSFQRGRKQHDSISAAEDFCQKDFEDKILSNIRFVTDAVLSEEPNNQDELNKK